MRALEGRRSARAGDGDRTTGERSDFGRRGRAGAKVDRGRREIAHRREANRPAPDFFMSRPCWPTFRAIAGVSRRNFRAGRLFLPGQRRRGSDRDCERHFVRPGRNRVDERRRREGTIRQRTRSRHGFHQQHGCFRSAIAFWRREAFRLRTRTRRRRDSRVREYQDSVDRESGSACHPEPGEARRRTSQSHESLLDETFRITRSRWLERGRSPAC